MRSTLTYAGRLVASPFPGELAPPEPLSMLLLSENDYSSLCEYENDVREPVLLSYAQHYQLLEDLVRMALERLPTLNHVLVRFHTVYRRPIPPSLLQPRVLLVDDPEARAADLLRSGADEVLVISDRFRRDSKERGENTIAVTWHTRTPDRQRYADFLRAARFHRGTERCDEPPRITANDELESSAMNYAVHYGDLIVDALESISPIPVKLKAELQRSVVGLLDSALIIETPCISFDRKPADMNSTLRVDERFALAMNAIVAAVEVDGLAPHYMSMMRQFATEMFTLFSTDEQMQKVKAWVGAGSSSCFLMTDAGGPSPAYWRTQVRSIDDKQVLHVDKQWAMGGDGDLFAIVAASVPNGLYPTAFLLSPEQCRALRRTEAGPPMLDGAIRLQNVKGQVEVSNADKLTKGGPTMLNRLLTIVRPQLVRCLMSHLKWLDRTGRIALHTDTRKAAESLQAIAARLAVQPYGSAVVTQVMALKFASNELLNRLVADGFVHAATDQRDLLAFTKMEGSSYRCLREIYGKAYAYNRPAAVKAT